MLLKRFPIVFVVLFISIRFETARSEMQLNEPNHNFVDVVLIFNLNPISRERHVSPPSYAGLKKVLENLKSVPYFLLDAIHAKVAIAKVEGANSVVVKTLESKYDDPDAVFYELDYDAGKHKAVHADKNWMKHVKDVEKKVFNENAGDRSHIPNVNVYIGLFPKEKATQDLKQWANEALIKIEENMKLGGVDVGVLVSGFSDEDDFTISHWLNGTVRRYATKNLAKEGAKQIVELGIQIELGKCNYDVVKWEEESRCEPVHGDEVNLCHKEGIFVGNLKSGVAADRKYCVDGTGMMECFEGKCELDCNELVEWGPCDCKTRQLKFLQYTRQRCEEKKDPDNLPRKSCKCPTPPPDMYELTMPVWAIFLMTICLILLTTVVATLIVYFGFFPIPKGYTVRDGAPPKYGNQFGGRREWFQQSMRSMVSFRGRRTERTERTAKPYASTVTRSRR